MSINHIVSIKLFPLTEFPDVEKGIGNDEHFSKDVITIDEHGLSGIAYYNFTDKEWLFHTDTLIDYNEKGKETKWMWYYPPIDQTSLDENNYKN